MNRNNTKTKILLLCMCNSQKGLIFFVGFKTLKCMSVEFVFCFRFVLVNESFESSRWQMKGTVDRSINKPLCLHLNLQTKNKVKHDKCSLLELKYENGSC